MTKILQILQMLLGIAPIVLTLIQSFEVPGFGKEKKQVILDAVGLFYDQLQITVIAREKLLGIVGSFIDIAVGFFNAVGWFKHGNPISNS